MNIFGFWYPWTFDGESTFIQYAVPAILLRQAPATAHAWNFFSFHLYQRKLFLVVMKRLKYETQNQKDVCHNHWQMYF